MRDKILPFLWLMLISGLVGLGMMNGDVIDASPGTPTRQSPSHPSPSLEPEAAVPRLYHVSPGDDPEEGEPIQLSSTSGLSPGSIIAIRDVRKVMLGRVVTVAGEISKRVNHAKGHVFLWIYDETGSLKVPLFANTGIPTHDLRPGAVVRVTGRVDIYRGELEVIPNGREDVRVVFSASRNESVSERDLGQERTIVGEVLTKYDHPDGHVFLKLLVLDTDDEINVPIFRSLSYDASRISERAVVRVRGRVSKYKGRLQIVPSAPSDIQILRKGYHGRVELVDLGAIGPHMRGRMVQVRGFVSNVSTGGGHTFFRLHDNRGASHRAVLFDFSFTVIWPKSAFCARKPA